MPGNRCLFRKAWLLKYTWILEGDSKSIAVCKSCKKTINIASMGLQHMRKVTNIKGILSANK